MPAIKRKAISYFRGKRIAIPLAAIGIIVFFAIGGHGKIAGFVVSRVVGYLMGDVDVTDGELLSVAQAEEVSETSPAAQSTRDLSTPTPDQASKGMPSEPEESVITQAQSKMSAQPPAAREQETQEKHRLHAGRAYTASYLRDPFYSLISSEETKPTKLLDVSRAKMVGSVWGEKGIIALLEDDRGRSYALKVGDKVVNGKVTSVTPGSVTFTITVFGMTKQVTLEIAEEGEW